MSLAIYWSIARHMVRWLVLVATLHAVPASAQEAYTLGPGDVLEFWLAQDEQLNRSVTVGPDGRLSLPLIGHLMAQGRTVEELEQEAVARLSNYFTDTLDLAIMLQPHPAHLPSVFVAGEVSEPGVFAYRPGMTVLHAITLAGGLYRTPLEASDLDRSIVLQSEIDAGEKNVAELILSIARLEAELSQAETIAFPPGIELDLPQAQLDILLQREQALLDARRAERTAVAETAGQMKEVSERNIAAIKHQQETVVRRRELLEQRRSSAATLVDRGHMQRSMLIEQEGELAVLDGVAGELEASLASAQGSQITEEDRARAVTREREIEIISEINSLRRDLEAARARMGDNRQALAVYEFDVGSNEQAALVYRILRMTGGRAHEFEASRATIIQAGDLVEVAKPSLGASLAPATD